MPSGCVWRFFYSSARLSSPQWSSRNSFMFCVTWWLVNVWCWSSRVPGCRALGRWPSFDMTQRLNRTERTRTDLSWPSCVLKYQSDSPKTSTPPSSLCKSASFRGKFQFGRFCFFVCVDSKFCSHMRTILPHHVKRYKNVHKYSCSMVNWSSSKLVVSTGKCLITYFLRPFSLVPLAVESTQLTLCHSLI